MSFLLYQCSTHVEFLGWHTATQCKLLWQKNSIRKQLIKASDARDRKKIIATANMYVVDEYLRYRLPPFSAGDHCRTQTRIFEKIIFDETHPLFTQKAFGCMTEAAGGFRVNFNLLHFEPLFLGKTPDLLLC